MMSVNTGSPTYSKLFLVVPVKLSTCTMMVAIPSLLPGVLHVMNSLQNDNTVQQFMTSVMCGTIIYVV